MAAAVGAAAVISLAKSVNKALFMMNGYQICPYNAFRRLARAQAIVLQERTIHSFNVPFTLSITWFTNYRPGDSCSSRQDLETFSEIYLSKPNNTKNKQ